MPPCDSAFRDRVIVVLGTVRSGTTWLVEMLGAHPDIGTTTGESWLFHSLWDFWLNAHSPVDGLSAYMEPEEIAAALRRFCDRLVATALSREAPAASWFIEKTPGHFARIPLMAATHPDAWYVHIVRDGRDVTRSIMQTSWGNSEPADAAAYWAWGVRNVLDQGSRLPRFRQLRYEDLLVDPVGEVHRLLDWMGLDVDASVRDRLEDRAAQEVSRFSATDPVGSGKWRDLPDESLEHIYEEASDLLVELGYAEGPEILRRGPSAGSA